MTLAHGKPEVFGLLGNPIGHSLSPLMHNAAFARMGIEAAYIPFRVVHLKDALRGIRGLDIRGVSVTLPFKTGVMSHLDEVEASARQMGAANTVLNQEGRLSGHNTDWMGLVFALRERLEIQGKSFVILGAGGAARAALFGILKDGGIPVIVNRSAERGEALAHEFGCRFLPLSEVRNLQADCLINATPVGMVPNADQMPIPAASLKGFQWVMDMIYNPIETRLLREAGEAGCSAINGLGMFVHQGAEQIKLWTGMEPPRAYMREVVQEELQRRHGD